MTNKYKINISKYELKVLIDTFLLLEKFTTAYRMTMPLSSIKKWASRIWQSLQISTVLYVNKIITNCIKHIDCKCKVQKCRLF